MANNIRTSGKGKVKTLSNLRPTFEKVRKDGASNVIIEQRGGDAGDLTVEFPDGTVDKHGFGSWSVLTQVMRTNRAMSGTPATAVFLTGRRLKGRVGTDFSNSVVNVTSIESAKMRRKSGGGVSQRSLDRA